MLLGWLNAQRATEIGVSLADEYASRSVHFHGADRNRGSGTSKQSDGLRDLLQRADREVRAISLNFYKKAKLANAFKWRLLEKGVAGNTAAEVTQTLVMHLSMNRLTAGANETADVDPASISPKHLPSRRNTAQLLAQADQYVARAAYAEAIDAYEGFLKVKPHDPRVLTNLGAAYWKLGRYREAEQQFRHAIRVKPQMADAHFNLGSVQHTQGQLSAAENSLRRAVKLEPHHLEARAGLGWTLINMGRLPEAKRQFDKVLKLSPRHGSALLGLATVARGDGCFDEAEILIQRVLDVTPEQPSAWAALAQLRKMASADHPWCERAEAIAAGAITPLQEADLRFAIGKYYDDIGEFARAFGSYRRANEILKAHALPYDMQARELFVADLMRSHSRELLEPDHASSLDVSRASAKPVFVVGMPRSGTSLVEQIIASHPAAAGAGELRFWTALMQRHDAALRQGPLAGPLRATAAHEYLGQLARHSAAALRVVDKAPINSDYLGIIHTVFPNARIIYLQRDPLDTCLSCYFQQFSTALEYSMDLADLAHYYRSHARLAAHWHTVLPADSILDVPYAGLVGEPAVWIRRMLDFLDLPWDERCLDFHTTSRTVASASTWQVRQQIYHSSLERWRNYKRFIDPLLALKAE
ncbi:MAG TPA: sulfotransferase [Steroidobacteraceae bacterium]|jgi:tetratricopeptide (TPR) repeat protein|nr:sulfotransferase [Steroidobacteraceae bacterium]